MKTFIRLMILLCIVLYTLPITLGAGSARVTVTQPVPGVSCGPANEKGEVECLVPTGFTGVQNVIGEMIKYFTYIALLGAVLFIIINGIMYSMAGMNDSLKATAKERITKTLIGLVILLLSGFILNTLAPWVYK